MIDQLSQVIFIIKVTFWACNINWRLFSTSSRRFIFSSCSFCFFSSTSRCLRSSSAFFFWAKRTSSCSRRVYGLKNLILKPISEFIRRFWLTLRLAWWSLSLRSSSSSLARCLRHSWIYSLSWSSKSVLSRFSSCLWKYKQGHNI